MIQGRGEEPSGEEELGKRGRREPHRENEFIKRLLNV